MSNQFSYSDIIYLTLDGEATDTERMTLFEKLSEDKSLQDEFQDAINIKNQSLSDHGFIQPSNAVFSSLMQNAGLIVPATAVVSSFSIYVDKLSRFLSGNLFKYMISFAFGIASTLGFLSYWTNESSEPSEQLVAQKVINNVKIGGIGYPEFQLKKHQKSAAGFSSQNFKKPVTRRIISTDHYITTRSSTLMSAEVIPSEPQNTMEIENNLNLISEAKYDLIAKKLDPIRSDKRFEPSKVFEIDHESDVEIDQKYGLSLELNGNNGLVYYPERDIYSGYEPIFNNNSMGLLYNVSENFSAGIELGQETLPLFIVDNTELVFKKSQIWGAVKLRYNFEMFNIKMIAPYVDFLAGGMQVGPMSKLRIGLNYMPYDQVNLFIAAEGGYYYYKYLGKYESTQKFGIHYGISLGF